MNRIELATLLQQPWCMLPEYAQALLPIVSSILNGTTEKQDFSAERESMMPIMASMGKTVKSWNTADALQGSVMVLNLKGPILKDSQMCGPVGTQEIAQKIIEAKSNTNIVGIVCVMESGGGSAYAVKPMADAIASFTKDKPFISLCEDVMASAAYYIASYSTEIFANNPKSIIGSIGTMTSIQDIKPAMEKLGVKFHEIYATESTSKNKIYNDVLAGDYKGYISKMLDPLNQDFIAEVKNNRAGRISTSESLIYQGETWFASVAKELGMIDQLGGLDSAIARVRELSPNHQSTQKQNMKFDNIQALAGIENPTAEQLDLANAELTTAGIVNATMVAESFITEAANATELSAQLTQQLADANSALATAQTTAQAELATANTAIQTNAATITDLQAKVTAFGANAGAIHSVKTAHTEKQADVEETDYEALLANMPHNRMADKFTNT